MHTGHVKLGQDLQSFTGIANCHLGVIFVHTPLRLVIMLDRPPANWCEVDVVHPQCFDAYPNFGAFCFDVGTLTFCQLMGVPLNR